MIAEELQRDFGIENAEVDCVILEAKKVNGETYLSIPFSKKLRCQIKTSEKGKTFALQLSNGGVLIFNFDNLKKLLN